MSRKKKDLTKELAQELDVFDSMLTALVELLEEKDILTQEEWENKIRAKLGKSIKSFRKIEFADTK